MRQLVSTIRRFAPTEMPILITGESGTGKELVARALHAESGRSDGPFVAVNCAGVPPDLLESEFFGHVRGAFSGAQQSRSGLFHTADGGTLFLDEIGEMPAALQAKLLRVLEDGSLRPVGADREDHVDVRVIAATNLDLEGAVAERAFRADLFYRLEGLRIDVPPLRERGDDIDLLTAHFLTRHCRRSGRAIPEIGSGVLGRLRSYPFPGNVRELMNAIERAVTFCGDGPLRQDHLPSRIRGGTSAGLIEQLAPEGELPSLAEIERRYLLYALHRCDGNKRRCAHTLGIGRRTLYRKLGEE